jgi:hypothetical protein
VIGGKMALFGRKEYIFGNAEEKPEKRLEKRSWRRSERVKKGIVEYFYQP